MKISEEDFPLLKEALEIYIQRLNAIKSGCFLHAKVMDRDPKVVESAVKDLNHHHQLCKKINRCKELIGD